MLISSRRFWRIAKPQPIVFQILLFLTFCFPSLNAAYINRYTTINNGGISFTGNTIGLSKQAGANQPGTADSIGAFITPGPAQVGNYPASTNTPPDGTTLSWQNNSSSAVLDLPTGSTVLYAELIWTGSYGFAGQIPYPGNPFLPDVTSVSLTTPQLAVHSIAPDPTTSQRAVTPGFNNMGNYVRSQNVTSIIQASGAGTYIVGGVPATVAASDDTHNSAGWTLAVVYENPNMLTSNLTIFVGCEQSSSGVPPPPPAQVSGFCAPPSGLINARLFVSATEGDYNKSGDQMRFGPTSILTGANAVSGSNNPVNNFFGSQINTLLPLSTDPATGKLFATGSSILDTRGSYGSKNFPISGSYPNNFGRQGCDITSVDVTSQMSFNQTQAFAQGTTSGDDYTITGLGIQISVGSPILKSTKTVNGNQSVISAVGDTVTYDFTIANTGTGTAYNCVFKDILQTGLTFVSGTFKFNNVLQSDPNLNTGFPIPGGTIPVGSSVSIEFQAKINALPLTLQTYDNQGIIDYDFVPCIGSTTPLTASTNVVYINFLPQANPDFGKTNVGVPLDGASVLDNDLGTGKVVTSYTQPSQGTVVVNPDGTYLYTPTGGPGSYTDTFQYTLTDIFGNTSTTTVTIQVLGSNPLPIANDDSNSTLINTAINTTLSGVSVLDNDIGVGLHVTTLGPITTSQGGTVTLNPNGTYFYVPPLDFIGIDTFPYTAVDADSNSVSATVYITVYPIIVANPDSGTTFQNTPFNGPSVLDNDSGQQIIIVNYTQGAQGGTVVMNPDGTYLYTPPLNFTGVDTFTYTIEDSFANRATATVTITVLPPSPTGFIGTLNKCKLLKKTSYNLNTSWAASTSPNVIAYNIYYGNDIIQTIPANGPLKATICLPNKYAAPNYEITALSSSGVESEPSKIRIIND